MIEKDAMAEIGATAAALILPRAKLQEEICAEADRQPAFERRTDRRCTASSKI
jgi:hypothetical protein